MKKKYSKVTKQEARQKLQNLNLEDDWLFAQVMAGHEICRKVIERILNVSIKKVEFIESQKTIYGNYKGRGIRLDVYLNDEKSTIYNIEMQRTKGHFLPGRSRYYLSVIDMDNMRGGDSYESIQNTFIIFICTFDPFEEGRHIYTFENRCVEDNSLSLKDGAVKIFLNTRGNLNDVDEEMLEFLSYFENSNDEYAQNAKSELVKELHQRVIDVKNSKESEVDYMTLLQFERDKIREGLEEGLEQGREEGREEGLEIGLKRGRERGEIQKLVSLVRKKLDKGNDIYEIADMLEEDMDVIKEIVDILEKRQGISDSEIAELMLKEKVLV